MFKPSSATNIKEYFENLPEDRKSQIEFLDKFIKKSAPKLKAYFATNMLGYGKFEYKNNKKITLEWPVVALANQKNYISLYVCALDKNEYIAEIYKNDLGKVKVGRSCINIKKLEDVNLKALEKVLKFAEKNPGLVYK